MLDDPRAARLVHQVLRAAEEGNALAADTLLRARGDPAARGSTAGALPQRADPVGRARGSRHARVPCWRSGWPIRRRWSSSAADLGTGPFALLRAFRDAYGLPPHAWLTDARVRRARQLLDAGTAPAEAAVAVGFTDQPHLNRHFTRIVGVPPGAYQRERKNVQDPAGPTRLASGSWQNRQLIRTQVTWTSEPTPGENPTAPSYGTPWRSGSP